MEITEVKVFPIQEEKLKAFVSIVFDRCFMVNDVKIIQGRDGLFISMPSRKKKNGEFKDVAHPLNNETRRMIETEVVAEYERVLADRGEELPAPQRPYPGAGDAVPAGARPVPGAASADGEDTRDEAPPARAEEAARPAPSPSAPPVAPDSLPMAASAASGRGADGSGSPDGAAGDGRSAAGGSTEPSDEAAEPDEAASLEEVQERHLRDSFWSVS